jgi:hypothetical protein
MPSPAGQGGFLGLFSFKYFRSSHDIEKKKK